MVEHLVVVQGVAGSSPVGHPFPSEIEFRRVFVSLRTFIPVRFVFRFRAVPAPLPGRHRPVGQRSRFVRGFAARSAALFCVGFLGAFLS